MSGAVTILALRPTAKALPLRFAATATLIALGAALLLRNTPDTGLIVASIFLAAAVAPVLDDPAAATLDSSATPLWARRAVRLILSLPTLGCGWLLLLATAALLAPAGTEVPFAVATWHWIGMIAVVLTTSCVTAALTRPSFDGSTSVAGLLAVLLGDICIQRLWPKVGVFLLADPALSTQLQVRMTALVAVAILALAVSSRDPATSN